MRFFILEDEINKPPRNEILRILSPYHHLTVCTQATIAKDCWTGDYDVALFDHDMNGQFGEPCAKGTGGEFVMGWLCPYGNHMTPNRDKMRVIIHSQNTKGAAMMHQNLKSYGWHSEIMPFSSSFLEHLRVMYVPGYAKAQPTIMPEVK